MGEPYWPVLSCFQARDYGSPSRLAESLPVLESVVNLNQEHTMAYDVPIDDPTKRAKVHVGACGHWNMRARGGTTFWLTTAGTGLYRERDAAWVAVERAGKRSVSAHAHVGVPECALMGGLWSARSGACLG